MKKNLIGECISEFIGSWILIFIGCGSVASLVLSGADISQWEISIIWGIAVTIAVYITGSVSGTQINPAVTIGLMIHRNFPKEKVMRYGRIAEEGQKYQLDLWKANELVLLEAGVQKNHIEMTEICTCCNPELLFSHRASKGKRGNLAAFLSLK